MPPSLKGGNNAASFRCENLFAVLRGLAFGGRLFRSRLDAFRAVGLGGCHCLYHLLFCGLARVFLANLATIGDNRLVVTASNFLAWFYYLQVRPLYPRPPFPNFGKRKKPRRSEVFAFSYNYLFRLILSLCRCACSRGNLPRCRVRTRLRRFPVRDIRPARGALLRRDR